LYVVESLKSLMILWTTGFIWAQVRQINCLGSSFSTCVLINWMFCYTYHPKIPPQFLGPNPETTLHVVLRPKPPSFPMSRSQYVTPQMLTCVLHMSLARWSTKGSWRLVLTWSNPNLDFGQHHLHHHLYVLLLVIVSCASHTCPSYGLLVRRRKSPCQR
jgi:hypothetical protein